MVAVLFLSIIFHVLFIVKALQVKRRTDVEFRFNLSGVNDTSKTKLLSINCKLDGKLGSFNYFDS